MGERADQIEREIQQERGELTILTAWEVADARRFLASSGWCNTDCPTSLSTTNEG